MKKKFAIFAMFLGLASVAVGNDTIFSDNFDSENGGIVATRYAGFANWTVSEGAVDLKGPGWDYFPGNGLYVDMHGSPPNPGKITSDAFNLEPGTYALSFGLATYYGEESITVQVGGTGTLLDKSYALCSASFFPAFTETFTVSTTTTAAISFKGAGTDEFGMHLDNVTLESVSHTPAPGAFLLGGIGVGLVNWLRRRRIL